MTLRRPLVLAAGSRSELPNGDQLPIDTLQLPQGLIDGLQMKWVSGTALTLSRGSCYIEGSGKVLRVTADIAKTGLSLSASTWYHVYPYDNAGTPDFELSTTAPASPYNGTARSKTGDSSKRYAGSVRTDPSGNIVNFLHDGNAIKLGVYVRILSSGTATSATSVSASGTAPVTARIITVRIINTATTGSIRTKISDDGGSAGLATVSPGKDAYLDHRVDSTQALQYFYYDFSPSGGVAYIDVYGYTFER